MLMDSISIFRGHLMIFLVCSRYGCLHPHLNKQPPGSLHGHGDEADDGIGHREMKHEVVDVCPLRDAASCRMRFFPRGYQGKGVQYDAN